ncbi:MAG TPA: dephospho-CoA kinase [Dongiaceae bacterium]
MIVIGLTGSVGMGKSTAAAFLKCMGLPVHDADRTVHRLMAKGGAAVAAVEAAFPGVVCDGAVDRRLLGARVFGRGAEMKRLEAILHPMVRRAERRFLERCRSRRLPIAVLDIPLLYETGGEKRCDLVIVLTAPQFLQDQRVLRRSGMSPQRLAEIKAKQMPDVEKRKRADIVINTGIDFRHTRTALFHATRKLKHR